MTKTESSRVVSDPDPQGLPRQVLEGLFTDVSWDSPTALVAPTIPCALSDVLSL